MGVEGLRRPFKACAAATSPTPPSRVGAPPRPARPRPAGASSSCSRRPQRHTLGLPASECLCMAGVRPSAAGGALFDAFCLGPEGEEVCLGAGLEREDALERVKIAGWWHRLHACDDISGVEIDEPGWTEEDSTYFAELSWQGLLDSVWGGGGQAEEPGEPAGSEPQVGAACSARFCVPF